MLLFYVWWRVDFFISFFNLPQFKSVSPCRFAVTLQTSKPLVSLVSHYFMHFNCMYFLLCEILTLFTWRLQISPLDFLTLLPYWTFILSIYFFFFFFHFLNCAKLTWSKIHLSRQSSSHQELVAQALHQGAVFNNWIKQIPVWNLN